MYQKPADCILVRLFHKAYFPFINYKDNEIAINTMRGKNWTVEKLHTFIKVLNILRKYVTSEIKWVTYESIYCMTTHRSYEIAMLVILPKIGSNYATRKQNPEKNKMKICSIRI